MFNPQNPIREHPYSLLSSIKIFLYYTIVMAIILIFVIVVNKNNNNDTSSNYSYNNHVTSPNTDDSLP
ncbi:hypothetical protein CUMW_216600 [Citrus unshiu]|uniref:Uncharacterized protein n=2 Tax=Citrus TaxID=2706 RepID=A0A067E2H1_CITSI|nr:hypothetical protein CISIN_1g037656mg [Citrus sinensis]GAY62286.1 hypothetical protein CUMW_216600 [Citrus unshiu]